MRKLRESVRRVFDVRPGERIITLLMSLYLMFVLFAYYILKPVSRGLFLNRIDLDKLPWLYVLIAAIGGVLAYFYSKLAVKTTLAHAVTGATAFSIACLLILWWLLRTENPPVWVLYAFNIWVSLFSIVLVSQGWLVAANVFDPRQAKRLYGVLGVGAVFGAAFGGSFTAWTVDAFGIHNLLLASGGMVLLSYLMFLAVARRKRRELATASAAEENPADFSFRDIVSSIARHRHLQAIIAIICITYMVDVMIEYQFNAMAKLAYSDKEDLTAFLGNFYGLYLNLITFVLQFFLTALVVGRFGVGGALQIMPVSIAIASLGTYLFQGLGFSAGARLAEASTRIPSIAPAWNCSTCRFRRTSRTGPKPLWTSSRTACPAEWAVSCCCCSPVPCTSPCGESRWSRSASRWYGFCCRTAPGTNTSRRCASGWRCGGSIWRTCG